MEKQVLTFLANEAEIAKNLARNKELREANKALLKNPRLGNILGEIRRKPGKKKKRKRETSESESEEEPGDSAPILQPSSSSSSSGSKEEKGTARKRIKKVLNAAINKPKGPGQRHPIAKKVGK